LKALGYNDIFHGFSATLGNVRDCEMWLAALKAKYDNKGKPFGCKGFDQLLGHCQSTTKDASKSTANSRLPSTICPDERITDLEKVPIPKPR
jgi:hypothetical protein